MTAQDVFDIAMGHMDELNLIGHSVHTDTRDYLRRTPFILTALCGELYRFSDGSDRGDVNVRPVYPGAIDGMDDEIELDGFLAKTVLPYGLAAHLLSEETPALAAFFLQRYQGLLLNYGGAIPRVSENITDVYS